MGTVFNCQLFTVAANKVLFPSAHWHCWQEGHPAHTNLCQVIPKGSVWNKWRKNWDATAQPRFIWKRVVNRELEGTGQAISETQQVVLYSAGRTPSFIADCCNVCQALENSLVLVPELAHLRIFILRYTNVLIIIIITHWKYLAFDASLVFELLWPRVTDFSCSEETLCLRRSLPVPRDCCNVVLTSLVGCDDSSVDIDWSDPEQVDAVSSW